MKKFAWIMLATIAGMLTLMVGSAFSQEPVAPAGEFVPWRVACTHETGEFEVYMYEKYGETPFMASEESEEHFWVEILQNPESGTWTIMVKYPDGSVCVPISGEGSWDLRDGDPPVRGDPA
jgi:hypothetical protein